MAVVGQRDAQPDEIHQGAGFAGDDVSLSPHHLGQEAEPRALRTDEAIQGVDPTEEHGVFDVERVVGRAHQRPQVAVHVSRAGPSGELVVRREKRMLLEHQMDQILGLASADFEPNSRTQVISDLIGKPRTRPVRTETLGMCSIILAIVSRRSAVPSGATIGRGFLVGVSGGQGVEHERLVVGVRFGSG